MKKSGKIQGIEKIICSATAPFWFMENNTQNRKLMVVAVQTVLKQANLKDVEVRTEETCNNKYSVIRGECRVDVDVQVKPDIWVRYRFSILPSGVADFKKIECCTTKIEGIQVIIPQIVPGASEQDIIDHLNDPSQNWKQHEEGRDWRFYVPKNVRRIWKYLTLKEKLLVYIMADTLGYDEELD